MREDLKEIIKYKNTAVVIVAVLSLLALADWPYGYYTFLRWVILVSSGLLIYTSYELHKKFWVIVGVALLLLWNPIAPVHLDREIWAVLNVVAALLFGASFFFVRIKK